MLDKHLKQRAAAFGVYLHTGPTASALPLLAAQMGRPLSLDAALDTLQEARDGESQRLRGQAAAALMRCRPDPTADGGPMDGAWRRLLGTHAGQFDKAMRAKARRPGPERRRREDRHRDDHLVLHKLLARGRRGGENCEIRNHWADVHFDPHSFVTRATVSADVSRSVESFAVQSDPRNWSAVAPSAFQETYRVAERDDGGPKIDEAGKYERVATSADDLGKPWRGYLFEDVSFTWDELEAATFRNLLNIRFEVSSSLLRMDFSLYRSISSQVGMRALAGGLNVDSGFFTAEDLSGGWSRITGEKRVRVRNLSPDGSEFVEPVYTAQFLNLLAPALVGLFMDEFIFNGACFHPAQTESP
jgi:hypothetical protein